MKPQKLKPAVILLGKLPPPFFGPAIATEIILNSALKEDFNLIHFDTKLNKSIEGIGRLDFKKPLNIYNQYVRYIKLLQKNRVDLVVVPISQSTGGFIKDSVFIIFAKFFRVKTIIQLRGSNLRAWLVGTRFPVKQYAEFVIKANTAAIVLGNNLRYIFQGLIPDNKIFVVPNGADYPEFNEIKSKDSSLPSSRIKVLYLANLLPSKGILDVIKAFAYLDNSIELDAVGSSNEVIKKKCEELAGNADNIRFHGPVNRKKKIEFLNEADVFLFPPNKPEGHPWVIIEAMAAGLPIISTNQGAILESVEDGVNGYIIDSNDPKKIAETLEILKNDYVLRKSMGEKSRQLYEEKFTESKMVAKLAAVFNTVIENEN